MALRDNTLLNLLAVPVGLLIVKRFAERVDKEPVAKPADIIPKGFTLGPAGPSIKDFKIIPESFTPGQNQGSGLTFSPITIKTLESFDPTKKVTVPTYDPGLPVAQPIAQGKVKKFGTGVSLADLLARAR